MRLVTFEVQGEQKIGALLSNKGEDMVYDLCKMDSSIPPDMLAFLSQGEAAFERAQQAIPGST